MWLGPPPFSAITARGGGGAGAGGAGGSRSGGWGAESDGYSDTFMLSDDGTPSKERERDSEREREREHLDSADAQRLPHKELHPYPHASPHASIRETRYVPSRCPQLAAKRVV